MQEIGEFLRLVASYPRTPAIGGGFLVVIQLTIMYELLVQKSSPFYYEPLNLDYPPIAHRSKGAAYSVNVPEIDANRAVAGTEQKSFAVEFFACLIPGAINGEIFFNENFSIELLSPNILVHLNEQTESFAVPNGTFHLVVNYSNSNAEVYVNGEAVAFLSTEFNFNPGSAFAFDSNGMAVSDLAVYKRMLTVEEIVAHRDFMLYERDVSEYTDNEFIMIGEESIDWTGKYGLSDILYETSVGLNIFDTITARDDTTFIFALPAGEFDVAMKVQYDADATLEYTTNDTNWFPVTDELIDVSTVEQLSFRMTFTAGQEFRSLEAKSYEDLIVESGDEGVSINLSGKELGHYFDPTLRKTPRATGLSTWSFTVTGDYDGASFYVYIDPDDANRVVSNLGLNLTDGELVGTNFTINGGLGTVPGWNYVTYSAAVTNNFTINAQDVSFLSFAPEDITPDDYGIVFGYDTISALGGTIGVTESAEPIVSSRQWIAAN